MLILKNTEPFIASGTMDNTDGLTLISQSKVSNAVVAVTGFNIVVNGSTAWSVASTVTLKDTAGNVFAEIAVSALTGDAVLNEKSPGVTLGAAWFNCGAANQGLLIAPDVAATGSELVVRVTGFVSVIPSSLITSPPVTANPADNVTPSNGSVTNAKLANMAQSTIKARKTASTGSPEDCSASDIKTILSLSNVDNTSDATKNAAAVTLTNKTLTDPVINLAAVARTATADGLTTGTIADAGFRQHITVTSADANNIIVLPTPTPGVEVVLDVGATGFELRSSDPTTIAINGGTGANAESAIPANSTVFMRCVSATAWKGFFMDADGDVAKVEVAA